MDEWKEYTLGEIVTFQRGHDLVQTNFVEGKYLVAGSNGPIGYHNKFTTKGPGVTIGRSGNSIGVAHYYENDFWAHNTTLYSKEFHNSHPKFVYYLLKAFNFRFFDGGSAVPTLNRNHIHPIKIKIPEYSEQLRISDTLSSIDDKIDLLHRQNKILEALAETLFRHWFVVDKIWDGKLSEYIKAQGGYAFKSQDFREFGFAGVLKITNISMGWVDIINTQFVDEEIIKNIEEEKFRAKTGDFLIAMT